MRTRLLASLVMVASVGLVAAVPTTPAAATGPTVTVLNFTFSPKVVRTGLGGTVTWDFQDSATHTSTSTQGFWDSGSQTAGDAYSRTFTSSGSYAYVCTPHQSMASMQGAVNVPLSATGSPSRGWTIRWSTVTGAGGIVFDVQVRNPGSSTWRTLRNDTTSTSAKFNPSADGKYAVRARTMLGSGSSGWSPVRSLTIT